MARTPCPPLLATGIVRRLGIGRGMRVEGIFDPHRQRREAVLALTMPEGLRPELEERGLTTRLLVFRKPTEI